MTVPMKLQPGPDHVQSAEFSGRKRRLPIGAELYPDGMTLFRVWAPRCRSVRVVAFEQSRDLETVSIEMNAEGNGYFAASVAGLSAGDRYGFCLDQANRIWPDPASRCQPDGPEKLSQLIDQSHFTWTDDAWRGVETSGQVIYEMHIGTFTRQGTWTAAAAELRALSRSGMTLLEVMPVAEFPGEFGWGYDGVCLFAPTRLYGNPDDFRRFVDTAHSEGLGVILDVVYNHFGTVGHTIPQFSEAFRAEHYANEWGDAINFDGDNSQSVREFFLANVRYWISEFHLDGLRFDATHAIHDKSERHILGELATAAREAAGDRKIFLVAENQSQDVRLIQPVETGGYGMDAIWNDDFHHSARVRLTGVNEAYYSDYLGSVAELLAAIKEGFLYQGQWSRWEKRPRGTPTRGLPASAFVTFLQNHDQISNSGHGLRVDNLTSPGRLRALTALWLLAPQTPMFFQGQEFAATAPFLYFADNTGQQRRLVAQGRAKFLSQFPSLASDAAQAGLPDPADRSTFDQCRVDQTDRKTHQQIYSLHIDLLQLRRSDPLFRRQRSDLLDGTVLGPDCLSVRYFGDGQSDRLLLVNLGAELSLSPLPLPLLAPPAGCSWQLLWSSEAPAYGGSGAASIVRSDGWCVPGESAVVMTSI